MVDPSYLEAVADASPVTLYNAAYMVKCDWPYRIEELKNSSPTVAEKASKYLLDSKISRVSVTNLDVLNRANDIDAECVIPKDYLPFGQYDVRDMDTDERKRYSSLRRNYDTHVDASLASFEEFLTAYSSHAYDGEFAVPLQSDHTRSYADTYDEAVELLAQYGYSTDRIFMVGGIKDAGELQKFDALVELRDHAGPETHIHGLGMGTSLQWARIFREFPNLLDSVDNTTAAHQARSGRVYDTSITGNDLSVPRGEKSSTLIAYLLEFNLLLYAYITTDLPREGDLDDIFADVDLASYYRAYDGEVQGSLPTQFSG